jgi:CDP-diacylglycerol--serine O-phosphatidyltransferase
MTGSPASCFHAANLLTYASLGAAMGAIAMAMRGSAAGAGALIAAAVIADTFDGKYARLFGRTTAERDFGAQLDSLSDAAAFGLAPACCMAALMPSAPTPIVEITWWATAFVYAACAITRLGFYHLPGTSAATFVGVPAPVAALLWSSALLFAPGWTASAGIFATIGISMVVPLPIPRPAGIRMAAFVSWPVIVAAAHAAALIR